MTYANVVASLALFISLGGASYAAIVLPPRSVGPRQMQPGAVSPNDLSFPLMARSFTDSTATDLKKESCNSPPPLGSVGIACSTVVLGTQPLGHLTLHSPGQILVSAIAGLKDEGVAGTTAEVQLAISVDGKTSAGRFLNLNGGQAIEVPVQELDAVSSGPHSLGFGAIARRYSSNGPGDVVVSPVSIVATVFPPR